MIITKSRAKPVEGVYEIKSFPSPGRASVIDSFNRTKLIDLAGGYKVGDSILIVSGVVVRKVAPSSINFVNV